LKSQNTVISKNIFLEIILFLGLGFLLAFTPCVLPMLPIMTHVILGRTKNPRTIWGLGLSYVLGMASSYALVGALIAEIGKNLFMVMQNPIILSLFSIMFILLGLSTLGIIKIQLPQTLQNKTLGFEHKLKHGQYISAYLIGSLSLLVLSPCITAPMIGALAYITQLGQVWKGSLYLFMLGIGQGLPLMLFAVSAGHLLPKAGLWMQTIQRILAILLFSIATLLMYRITIYPWNAMSLLILTLCSGFLLRPQKTQALWSKIIRIIVLISIFSSAAYVIYDQIPEYNLSPVLTKKNIQNRIHQSKKPVILYFSAKWCLTCQFLEKNILRNKELQLLFKNNEWIKIDITQSTPDNQLIMKQFKIIAPPSVIRIKDAKMSPLYGEDITLDRLKNWQD
jgi:thiol:disulfide interchange protein DsbD